MRLRATIAATLLLAASGPTLAAQGLEAPSPEPFAEAIVELHFNEQDTATTLVVRRDVDGTLLLRAADLPGLRLKTPARGAMQVNGERYYRLGPEMDAVVAFDESAMTGRVTLPAKAFLPTQRVTSAADAPRVTRSGTGGFLNYDVSAEQTSDRTQGGGFFELGLFGDHGVLTSTMVVRHEPDRRDLARLETAWVRDFPDRIATLRIGDGITSSGSWGRALRYGGVQFGTNFSTQPMLVTTPLLAAQGEAVVPSTVDVFVNGRPVASEQVPPGPFSIDRLPVLTGAGQLQVVVTDALGRQQIITQPYYSGTALLREDLAEYSMELGSVRQDYGTHSFSYGDAIGVAAYRRGISNTLTAGARAEAQGSGIYALGGDAAWQAGQAGILTAQLAAGGDGSLAGVLAGVGVERSGETVSAFAQLQYATRDFVQSGMAELLYRPKQRSFAGLGFNLGQYGNAQLAYGRQTYYDSDTVGTVGLNYSIGLGTLGYLGLYASYSAAETSDTNLLLTWSMPIGDRRTVSAALQRSSTASAYGGGVEGEVTFQRDLPVGRGVGYRASLSTAERQDASLAYQGSAGIATIDYSRRDGKSGLRLGATGALAVTGAGVMPARQLNQSFAVVQVADYPGLTVFVDNQPVGRTDEHGRVLVEALRPYQNNAISLDPTEVPMDGSLAQSEISVTPAYRSGALVRFPVERALAATMRLLQVDGTPVPAGASARLGTESFPVVLDGVLYVEGLHDTARLQVEWNDGQCTVEARRPAGNDPVPDLGELRCR